MKNKKIIVLAMIFFLLQAGIALAKIELTMPETGLPNPDDGVKGILENLLSWLLSILGMVAVGAFIISGLQYFLAVGDEKQVETAKRNLKYSIYGVIVALSGFVVIQAIDSILNAVGLF